MCITSQMEGLSIFVYVIVHFVLWLKFMRCIRFCRTTLENKDGHCPVIRKKVYGMFNPEKWNGISYKHSMLQVTKLLISVAIIAQYKITITAKNVFDIALLAYLVLAVALLLQWAFNSWNRTSQIIPDPIFKIFLSLLSPSYNSLTLTFMTFCFQRFTESQTINRPKLFD